jgi:hypothetical protein
MLSVPMTSAAPDWATLMTRGEMMVPEVFWQPAARITTAADNKKHLSKGRKNAAPDPDCVNRKRVIDSPCLNIGMKGLLQRPFYLRRPPNSQGSRWGEMPALPKHEELEDYWRISGD